MNKDDDQIDESTSGAAKLFGVTAARISQLRFLLAGLGTMLVGMAGLRRRRTSRVASEDESITGCDTRRECERSRAVKAAPTFLRAECGKMPGEACKKSNSQLALLRHIAAGHFSVLFPYNTDAPIYHLPLATVGLIAVNTAVYIVVAQAEPSHVDPWILQFGAGLHPEQWITCNFLHTDILHLLGDMFFLWGFGLVVEGKLGWWRFWTLYLGIGVVQSVIIQAAMLGASGGGTPGSSGVIFGLMAISLVWAPKNEMSCFLWIFRFQLVELPITAFAGIYLAWEIVVAMLTRFSMSSAMLQLVGWGIGAAVGVGLLKLNLVDCEGWDWFAVWAGHEGRPAEPKTEPQKADSNQTPKPLDSERAAFLTSVVQNRLAAGNVAGAAQFYTEQRDAYPEWQLGEAALGQLIASLGNAKLWTQSIRPMVDFLHNHPEKSVRVRLKLAQILIEFEHRPGKALMVLANFDGVALTHDQQKLRERLQQQAELLQAKTDLEISDHENW